ncbi:MAG: hypothetical protein ACRD1R_07985 [Acidobacteriota bacterium]
MKPVQIMMDERLLAELDGREEVRKFGRSAVFRRVLQDYLRRRQKEDLNDQYRRAYGDSPGLGSEFTGWEEEGEWPKE